MIEKGGFTFRLISNNPLNPSNAPSGFERSALLKFGNTKLLPMN